MDNAIHTAQNAAAPPSERSDALRIAQRGAVAQVDSSALDFARELISHFQEQELIKAEQQADRSNIIVFPGKAKAERGMKSLALHDWQLSINGNWYERPGVFSFDSMRAMVEQTPILQAVIMTRIRQVQRFCRPQKENLPGFKIILKDNTKSPDTEEQNSIDLLQRFFLNCGWETNPRRRMRMKRDNFATFMAKLVRDSLTLDSAAIETEFKRDRNLGLDGLYAVDGATIRLCTERGYEGDDEVFALQVVQGLPKTIYTYDDLIYVPRNPRTDVTVGGYGLAETELLVRVVTGFLNAFTYNTRFFDSNAIPRGLLHLTGNYDTKDIAAFKRMWNSMVKGVNNSWTLPVMVSKDQESKAEFSELGNQADEMMFGKWMSFLASLICAIYGISPDEINFESFSTGKSSLSGDDTEEKIANSKDKGLVPLLSYFDSLFSDFVVSEFGDKFDFMWTGLDPEDREQKFEERKLCGTVNELRAQRNEKPIEEDWGNAPLNPSLVGVWQQALQAKQSDFGSPDGDPGADGDESPQGEDYGQEGAGADYGQAGGDNAQASGDGEQQKQPPPGANDEAMAKALAFGLPAFRIEV